MLGVWWSYEGHPVGLGMDEATVGVVLGLGVALTAIVWHLTERTAHRIEKKTFDLDLPDVDEMREAVEEIIADQLGTMRTPQLADHLGAILQQWAQVKMQKDIHRMNNAAQLVTDGVSPLQDD